MPADYLCQKERRDRRYHESDQRQAQRMVQDGALASFAPGKCGDKLRNARVEIHRQAKNGAQLNHDRIHLPVSAGKADMEQRFSDSQMCSGAYRYKFRQSLHDSQH
jgi:hypothetical protein